MMYNIATPFLLDYLYRPFCHKCGRRVDANWGNRSRGYECIDCYREANRKRAHERYQLRPETRKLNNKNSFYKRNGVVGKHTIDEWKAKLLEYDYRCAYCGNVLLDDITADHVIPITRGGTNYISNIVPACKRCNSSKNNKTADEYREYLKHGR